MVLHRCNAVCEFNHYAVCCDVSEVVIGTDGVCEDFIPRKIMEFQGDYRFLSNFYPCEVAHDHMVFPSAEHAYQAAKCDRPGDRLAIQQLDTPGQAKRFGRKVSMRRHWEHDKLQVMSQIVMSKFIMNPGIRRELLDLRGYILIEGNRWGDEFWGVCLETERGKNHLGKILMQVRDLLAK